MTLSFRRIRAIMRREFIDIRRDRRSLFLTFLYPICMLIMYGYGIRYDVDRVPLTILDWDETPESRSLSNELIRSGYFDLVRWARDEHDIDRDLHTDRSRIAVVIPRDFADTIRRGDTAVVQALIDGSESNSATIAQGYVLAMVGRYAATYGGRETAAPIEVRSRMWYNPELKSVNFIIPGIIGVIMMIVGAMLTSFSIVKEKDRGTIEQILVSPIRPLEMIIGKIVPYVVIAFLDLVIIVSAGYFVFGVPIKGSLFQLSLFATLYLICALGVGVYVSTIADSMRTAMIAAIFISLMPSILLSGFVFPLENMPVAVRILSYFFPGRYFVTAIRGIYLKAVGIEVLWPEAILLVLFGTGIIWLSVSRFRDTLE